ncbi:MAG: Ribonuclease HII [Parcubacteria group bacterium GW2011_GWA1_47_11]|nr:MAG: Ribonuclease HII [Parcubacteria group bacterium GW2011_GWA1_47_11]
MIDRTNILRAAQGAMRRAIRKLVLGSMYKVLRAKSHNTNYKIQDTIILVDGNRLIPKLKLPQRTIVKGDQKVFSIACASIIAKVCRDQIMIRYAKTYPQYGFAKHKGYGTKEHFAWLTTIGPSLIHRRSFTLTSKLL